MVGARGFEPPTPPAMPDRVSTNFRSGLLASICLKRLADRLRSLSQAVTQHHSFEPPVNPQLGPKSCPLLAAFSRSAFGPGDTKADARRGSRPLSVVMEILAGFCLSSPCAAGPG